jgi:uroporphyrinogen decarboxylase
MGEDMARIYTRRERVETALNHREPDKCPADITIEPSAYDELCKYLGCKFEPYYWDDWNHAYPSVEVLEKLNVDVCHVDIHNSPKGFDLEVTEYKDAWGVKRRKVFGEGGGFSYQFADYPLENAETVEDIVNYNHWPKAEELIDISHLEEEVKYLYNNTDFALMATFGGNIFERPHYLRSMQNFFIDLMSDEEFSKALIGKVLEIQKQVDELIIKTIGKYLTYMRLHGEDLGSQSGQLISLGTFNNVVRPFMQDEWNWIKALNKKYGPQCKLAVHSCGAVFNFVPTFIEMGADILNPVQPNAKGMDTKLLKESYGDKICFHGAINTQGVLASGTVADVRNEVRTRIRDLAPGGGYICAPSHNIQYGMSAENILAMYEAIQEFGKYPIAC